MLSNLIGAVDWPAAAIVVAIAIALCITVTTYIGKRRSRQEISNEFELAKMKQEGEQTLQMAKAAAARDFDMARVEQGLITSHRSND